MSVIALAVVAALAAASPRSAANVKKQSEVDAPLGVALDLTGSVTARPERSKGGTDPLLQLGLRGAYLWGVTGRSGPVVGGELALRTLGIPESDGSSQVGSDLFTLSTQAGALAGYRLATRNLTLTPHLSAGVLNDVVLVHLKSPGAESWRPRWLPGAYLGGGVVGSFFMVMLRLDSALGVLDGRPVYRFDTGLGVLF
ncbi:MAG: hypothetical protein ABIJ09_09260 [Pseudomonadota bacterium]